MRRAPLSLGLLLLACGGAQPAAPFVAPKLSMVAAAPASTPCSAESARAEAHQRATRGELFAALRRFQWARERCPSAGKAPEEATLRERLVDARSQSELLDAARAANLAGNEREARLLEDRAAFALEAAKEGTRLEAWVPPAGRDEVQLFWTPDSQWLLSLNYQGLTLRHRDEWYPRYRRALADIAILTERPAFSDDGASLLVPLSALDSASTPRRRLAIVDVRPGASFGVERARYAERPNPGSGFVGNDYVALTEPKSDESTVSQLVIHALKTGQIQHVASPKDDDSVIGWAASPDGNSLMVAHGERLSLISLPGGGVELLQERGVNWLNDPFTPDGRFVVWQDVGRLPWRLAIHDLQSGKTQRVPLVGCDATVGSVFDEGSKQVAVGGNQSRICLVELATGRVRHLLVRGSQQALPSEFVHHDSALWTYAEPLGALLALPSGRELWREKGIMGLIDIGDKPTLVFADGKLKVIEPSLSGRDVDPTPRPSDSSTTAVRLNDDVALALAGRWVIVDMSTGKTRPLEVPMQAELETTPDETLVATDGGRVPAVLDVASGKLVRASPTPFLEPTLLQVAEGYFRAHNRDHSLAWSALGLITDPPDEPVPSGCSDAYMTDASGRAGLKLDEEGAAWFVIDCATGTPRVALEDVGVPQVVLSPARALGYSKTTTGGVVVWDLRNGRALRTAPLEAARDMGAAALSPDDRYLALDRGVWDLSSGRRIGELTSAARDGGGFLSNELLVLREDGRLALFRAPKFERIGTIMLAADMKSIVVFVTNAAGEVKALEVIGNQTAFDSTLDCGIDVYGVPFRICRQMLERQGLLASLLEATPAEFLAPQPEAQ